MAFSIQRLVDCYAHYIQQVGVGGPKEVIGGGSAWVGLADRVREVCAHYPSIAQQWAHAFQQKFATEGGASAQTVALDVDSVAEIYLKDVVQPDRPIWDMLVRCLQHTVRTNFYVPTAQALVIKIEHAQSGVREIFMDHPRMQGVLLKGAMVARGGLRWSDRWDFRTECWQLMETQVLKNAMIVPSGAKGAFVCKDSAFLPIEAYRVFVEGLLDISDNLVDGHLVPADHVRCWDGGDYYNVVAADKGTASFSDEGNALAVQRGYWMGDAFASGGSKGYSHKKLAITSRGVWASVRHHMQCLQEGIGGAPQKVDRPWRMVGVGDMAGDVFGNGLLEEPQVILLAAFNHEAIFLDPQPDPVSSYAQRRRLFEMPGSRWSDYEGFSQGGGVYARSLTSIPLSDEAADMLGLSAGHHTPDAIIRAMLQMPVDILWLGGIGTYIKGTHEQHVPDQDNETVRIDGAGVRARIIAEGANLGVTPLGRVECAMKGVMLNTDSVDNCAGVHCSDREVNIKILLDQAMKSGSMTDTQRSQLLSTMTQDVCTLVLQENTWQNMALTLAQQQDGEARIQHVEQALRVYAAVCGSDDSMRALQEQLALAVDQGRQEVTRPEMALVLSFAKRALKTILKTQVSQIADWNAEEVVAYFPAALHHDCLPLINQHLLRLDIAVTACANRWIDMTGPVALGLWAHQWSTSLDRVVSLWRHIDQDLCGFRLKQRLDGRLSHDSMVDILEALHAYRSMVHGVIARAIHQGAEEPSKAHEWQADQGLQAIWDRYQPLVA